MRPAGHPETGLNTMTGFSGAGPDKHFIQATLRILNGSWDVIVDFLTSTELCYVGVPPSPWRQCDTGMQQRFKMGSTLRFHICENTSDPCIKRNRLWFVRQTRLTYRVGIRSNLNVQIVFSSRQSFIWQKSEGFLYPSVFLLFFLDRTVKQTFHL